MKSTIRQLLNLFKFDNDRETAKVTLVFAYAAPRRDAGVYSPPMAILHNFTHVLNGERHNVLPKPRSHTLGVVLELTDAELARLDVISESSGYERIVVEVDMPQYDKVVKAWVYQLIPSAVQCEAIPFSEIPLSIAA